MMDGKQTMVISFFYELWQNIPGNFNISQQIDKQIYILTVFKNESWKLELHGVAT